MPNKYYSLYTEEDKSKIKIFCSPTVNRKYKQQLQARNTALGDAYDVDRNWRYLDALTTVPPSSSTAINIGIFDAF